MVRPHVVLKLDARTRDVIAFAFHGLE